MQRARLALPHLRAHGWEPVVLAVDPSSVEGAVLDPLFEQTYPADLRVIRVRGLSPRLTRPLGFGSLWWRCGRALRRAGDDLLAREPFDLVFFTTTQFDAFTLGPRWRTRFGVPYVLDYQDPWVNDYYRRAHTRPPGGALKFRLTQYFARRREPAAVRSAAGLVSVSDRYGPDLLARYPELDPARIVHLPFGAAPSDLETARRHAPLHSLVPRGDGQVHIVYTGRCGPDMERALMLLFCALRRYRETHPPDAARLRFHFIGTDYAPPPLGRNRVLPVAQREGVADQVAEHCSRVSYFDALHYLVHADALLALGSDDPTYSASKIFPCLFARRPLLTLAHHASLMLTLARGQGIGTSYGFANPPTDSAPAHASVSDDTVIAQIHAEWFVAGGHRRAPAGDLSRLDEHTAAGMTARLASVFEAARARPVAP